VSDSIHSLHAINAQTQTQQAAQPSKQATTQTAIPQDKVSISESAKQALADNIKPAAGGDRDHDGDRH